MKFFIVTRADLPPGDLLAQTVHAAAEFAVRHRSTFEQWHTDSNTIIVKTAKGEKELRRLLDKARDRRLLHAQFHEPDMGGALTSVAFEPKAHSLVRDFPLAFSGEYNRGSLVP